MLTVIETCRIQKKDVFAWLIGAIEARQAGRLCPSLVTGV
jgi:hypothetical protein